MTAALPGDRSPVVRRRALLRAALALPPAAVLAGCDAGQPGTQPTPSAEPGTPTPPATPTAPAATPTPAGPPNPQIAGTVATGLAVPWGIAFLPDGSALVSERDRARIVRISASATTPVRGVPGVEPGGDNGGEGGLLGLALHPSGSWLYAYLTAAADNRVVRMSWDGARLGDPEVVLDGIDANVHHNGGALAFGPDGMLYAATGDAGDSSLAADPSSLNGKVLRLTDVGDPPGDNPDDSPVWSRGHRNVEGLAFDEQGRLWASEFGDKAYDELNRILRGADYGWPRVEGRGGPGRAPLAQWSTDECSPAGIAIAADRAWLGALRGECVWSVDLVTGESERHLEGHGRIRMVAAAPDGSLWVGTSNRDGRGDVRDGDDRILRVTL